MRSHCYGLDLIGPKIRRLGFDRHLSLVGGHVGCSQEPVELDLRFQEGRSLRSTYVSILPRNCRLLPGNIGDANHGGEQED